MLLVCGSGYAAEAEKLEQAYQKLKPKFNEAPEISVEQLNTEQANVVFIDVRDDDEQRVSMIPGAISVDEFTRSAAKYKNATIVAYCTIGYRSGTFTIKWQKRGYDVTNLKGGVLAWAQAGRVFQSPSGIETKRVHIYDDDWNYLPKSYIPIY